MNTMEKRLEKIEKAHGIGVPKRPDDMTDEELDRHIAILLRKVRGEEISVEDLDFRAANPIMIETDWRNDVSQEELKLRISSLMTQLGRGQL